MKSILLVDDSEAFRGAMTTLLGLDGFRVIGCPSASQAIEIAAAGGIDLVICDLGMPEMDGMAFAEALRHTPACSDLPMILLTGSGQCISASRCQALGIRAWLTKGQMTPRQFLSLIHAALDADQAVGA